MPVVTDRKEGAMHLFRNFFVVVLLLLFLLTDAKFSPALTLQPPDTETVFVEGDLSYIMVDTEGLATMLAKKNFLFINVHIPYEGEIEKTDFFIPYNEIEKHTDKLPADRNAMIVLYCRTDRMSNIAAKTLVRLGYKDVWVMKGGMIDWEGTGRPLLFIER
jgi:rhodanese-related sulfurtransferase